MTPPTILALDTSAEGCSVALSCNGAVLERFEVLPRGHAQHILPMIEAVLAEAGLAVSQLDAIAFCRGPGSFTGVRIAVGVVQGLAFGADLGVAPVSSLAALAQGALREHGAERVLAAIDARMGEVYWGVYQTERGCMLLRGEEAVLAPERVPAPQESGWTGAGTGWAAYGGPLRSRCGELAAVWPEALPRARDALPLAMRQWQAGELVAAEQALPVYLRDKVTD